jgi:glutamyl-Q tRNA(Asp) synthetase
MHLGHAYSALMNEQMAARAGGRLLLRIEDIDLARCTPEFEREIIGDLRWLGIAFHAPPQRQSDRVRLYAQALALLTARGLVYPCFCTRGDVARRAGGRRDPDGAALHLRRCAPKASAQCQPALRLDMAAALALVPQPLFWREYREGQSESAERADPAAWGDVVLKRRDAPGSYHLAVVIDDDSQRVSDVVRGRNLFQATAIHRLLQELLDIEPPNYRHHRLVCGSEGAKMSKSARSTTLAELRRRGAAASAVRDILGFEPRQGRLGGGDQFALAEIVAAAAGMELGAWAIN